MMTREEELESPKMNYPLENNLQRTNDDYMSDIW